MNKIEIGESSTDKLVTINNNVIKIYDKVNHIIELLSKSNNIVKEDELVKNTTELDENIKISNQKEEFIYSHVIPNLKVGRIIRQEFKYEWKTTEKQED